MRVAVKNIPGVDSVRVSLNQGYAEIAFAPENRVSVEQVRKAIRKNGFTPREARVRVRGRLARKESGIVLELPEGALRLMGPSELLARLGGAGGSAVVLEGVVSESVTGAVAALRVTRIVET